MTHIVSEQNDEILQITNHCYFYTTFCIYLKYVCKINAYFRLL